MNNVDERFNPFSFSRFFVSSCTGLRRRNLMGPHWNERRGRRLPRRFIRESRPTVYFIFKSGQVRSRIGFREGDRSNSKTFHLFFFFFIHLVSFVVFVVRSPTKVEQKSSYKNLFYSDKLLILYPVRPGKNIRRNSRGDIFTRETKKKDTFPFLSRWKGNASFSRAREKRVAVRDSEKVKLDPRARFLSASFPFYRESKEYPFRNGTLESQTFFRRRPLAK